MADDPSKLDPDHVNQAKQALIANAAKLNPMNAIRNHPFAGVGAAGVMGVLAGTQVLDHGAMLAREVSKFSNIAFTTAHKFIDGIRLALRDPNKPPENQ